LLKAGVVVGTINGNVAIGSNGMGSYVWPISTSGLTGNDFKVQVQSLSKPTVNDTSNNNFAILAPAPSIKVTSPNGGETWRRGTTPTIRWTSIGAVGTNVKIELLKGTVPQTITASTPNDGDFASWRIPLSQSTGTNFKIRIASTSNPAINDTSDAIFRII
jgi:hypothetical protein